MTRNLLRPPWQFTQASQPRSGPLAQPHLDDLLSRAGMPGPGRLSCGIHEAGFRLMLVLPCCSALMETWIEDAIPCAGGGLLPPRDWELLRHIGSMVQRGLTTVCPDHGDPKKTTALRYERFAHKLASAFKVPIRVTFCAPTLPTRAPLPGSRPGWSKLASDGK